MSSHSAAVPQGRLNLDPNAIIDIAVFRLDNLGDCVLTSGLIRNLRSQFPKSRITVFAWEMSAEYFRACPYANGVVPLARVSPPQRDQEQARALFDKFGAHFSGAFDLVINPRVAPDWYCCGMFVARTDAPLRVAFKQYEFVEGFDPNPYYNHLIEPTGQLPMAEINLEVIRALGVDPDSASPEVWPSTRARRRAAETLAHGEYHGGFCAVTIGAAVKHKIWPREYYSEIVSFLAREFRMVSVLVGTALDREAGAYVLRHNPKNCIDLTGRTTIDDLIGVLERCRLYVGNDTGPKHLAAALGMPIVEICSFPDATRDFPYDVGVMFAPYGVRSVIVRPGDGFSREEIIIGKAINTIRVDRVKEAIIEILSL